MISVIVPYYNRPEKLKRCINSILEQTHQDFEILVIDDYSIIPLKLDIDSRIKVYRNLENLGPGLSRNVGLENAKGDYIAFLDSDDYWDLNFLQICIKQFKVTNNIPVMVFTNALSVKENGVFPKRKWKTTTGTILPNILLKIRPWATSSCLWRANIIKNTKWLDSRNWEDYAFDIDVALKCNNVSQIDEYLTFYDNVGEDKLTNQIWKQSVSGKNKSLIYISKVLLNSDYRNDSVIKKALTTQFIKHILAIIGSESKDKSLILLIIKELKKWNGFAMGFCFELVNYLPKKIKLRFVRRLRRLWRLKA